MSDDLQMPVWLVTLPVLANVRARSADEAIERLTRRLDKAGFSPFREADPSERHAIKSEVPPEEADF